MGAKKQSPADALKTVVETLTPLEANERQWVLQSAGSFWSISVQTPTQPAGENPPLTPPGGIPPGAPASANVQDPKAFIKAKDPKSDLQRIAALAYYLTHGKNMAAFKTRDLTTANTDAKGPKFHIPRAVGNAARAKCGYLSAVGGGKKQLSAYGEEIIEALPDQDAVKALEAKHKKGKRKATKKTSKK